MNFEETLRGLLLLLHQWEINIMTVGFNQDMQFFSLSNIAYFSCNTHDIGQLLAQLMMLEG